MNKYEAWLEKYKHLTGAHNQKLHGRRGGQSVSQAAFSGTLERIAAGAISRLGEKLPKPTDFSYGRYFTEINYNMREIPHAAQGVMVDLSGERSKPMRDKDGNAIIGMVSNRTGRSPTVTYTDANGKKQTTSNMAEFEPIDVWLSDRQQAPVYTRQPDDEIGVPQWKR